MCEAKPGTRCAADTRSTVTTTLDRYQAAHPSGPVVGPLEAVTATYQATTLPTDRAPATPSVVRLYDDADDQWWDRDEQGSLTLYDVVDGQDVPWTTDKKAAAAVTSRDRHLVAFLAQDDDPDVRACAAMNTTAATQRVLQHLATDDNPEVKETARASLTYLGLPVPETTDHMVAEEAARRAEWNTAWDADQGDPARSPDDAHTTPDRAGKRVGMKSLRRQEKDCRQAFEDYREAQYATALTECNGQLLNRAGIAREKQTYALFIGPRHVAYANASEELVDFWRSHGRLTYAQFRRAWPFVRADQDDTGHAAA